ncbi:hypothetical protein HMPREF1579_00460, partial [Gardnerella vaginalis JCP8066]
ERLLIAARNRALSLLKVESTACFQRKRRRERAVTRELFAKFGTKSGNRQRYKRLTAETNITNSERKKARAKCPGFWLIAS